jgi:hypothetical protein
VPGTVVRRVVATELRAAWRRDGGDDSRRSRAPARRPGRHIDRPRRVRQDSPRAAGGDAGGGRVRRWCPAGRVGAPHRSGACPGQRRPGPAGSGTRRHEPDRGPASAARRPRCWLCSTTASTSCRHRPAWWSRCSRGAGKCASSPQAGNASTSRASSSFPSRRWACQQMARLTRSRPRRPASCSPRGPERPIPHSR